MKENLILKRYETQPVNGTFSMKETKTFFGSKMMELEDNIVIDSRTIQYSETSTGFQYYEDEKKEANETFKTPNLNNVKQNNHEIWQSKLNNQLWFFYIDGREILITYLFYKIKENRTFKSITTENLQDKNINDAIREYIEQNILNRYTFSKIDFFVKKQNITEEQNVKTSIQLGNNAKFDATIDDNQYLIDNYNTQTNRNIIGNITLTYALENPRINNFNYYFDLYFQKR